MKLTASETMFQHVVTEKKPSNTNIPSILIDDIDNIHPDTDDFQKIEVKIILPYLLPKDLKNNLKKKFGVNGPSINGYLECKIREWNKELESEHHVVSLSFGNSFPRIDVLQRLYAIANELESQPEFPKFRENRLEVVLKTVIGHKDPRTFKKYFDCIISFVKTKKDGTSIYGYYDVSGFRDAMEKVLTRAKHGEIEKI